LNNCSQCSEEVRWYLKKLIMIWLVMCTIAVLRKAIYSRRGLHNKKVKASLEPTPNHSLILPNVNKHNIAQSRKKSHPEPKEDNWPNEKEMKFAKIECFHLLVGLVFIVCIVLGVTELTHTFHALTHVMQEEFFPSDHRGMFVSFSFNF
ncbi:hypothetical protein RFI_17592, partial [Reticulomyxa filosa]